MTKFIRRLTPSVPFTFKGADGGDAAVRLSYNLNAFIAIQEEIGTDNVFDQLERLFQRKNAKTVSLLLWAAMLEYQPDYAGKDGLAAVRSALPLWQLGEAHSACVDAFIEQLPPERKAEVLEKAAAEAAAEAGKKNQDPFAPGPDETP